MNRALHRLREAEQHFHAALAAHASVAKNGGETVQVAALILAQASRAYRLALLDPNLPPI